jgi:glyoxylase-like metal-dependent hydrolase (beta-lactamase superfamily II)
VKHGDLDIEVFVDQMFGENAYVITAPGEGGEPVGWAIDPGFPPQVNHLLTHVADERIAVEKIILTHGHADHIAGLDVVHAAHSDAPVYLAEPDQPMLHDGNFNLSSPFGLEVTVETEADYDLPEGMELKLGRTSWKVLDTSGHSPGGRSLYCQNAGVVIVGDALFAGSIGRTDFPQCDHHRLIRNIREKLLTLPDPTVVYSGHGPATTIANERKLNPFLSD